MGNADRRQDEDALEEMGQTRWEERNKQGNANEDELPGWR